MTPDQGRAAPRPPLPRLHLIVDPALCQEHAIAPADLAERAVAGGRAVAVHLRGPGMTAAALWRLAIDLRAIIAPPALLIVNDRADVAVAAKADGVQLGDHGLPVAAARRVVGPRLLLGRSVHGVAEARAAEREGVDYALLGTIYPTASHPGVAGVGVALVRAVRAAVQLPLIAIGGIDQTTLDEVLDAGAAGVAIIRAVGAATDPSRAIAALYALMQGDTGGNGALPLPHAPDDSPDVGGRVSRSRRSRSHALRPVPHEGNVDGGDTA